VVDAMLGWFQCWMDAMLGGYAIMHCWMNAVLNWWVLAKGKGFGWCSVGWMLC